jgi:hypothetical protein
MGPQQLQLISKREQMIQALSGGKVRCACAAFR